MITIIAAVTATGVVGSNNQLPWPPRSIPRDMPHFREQTVNATVISGKKTSESMGVLKNRRNIVISNTMNETEGITIYSTLRESIAVEKFKNPDIFLLGGVGIWKEGIFLPDVKRAIITRVHATLEGDTYFPEEEFRQNFELFYSQKWKEDEPQLSASLEVWMRK
ncbi:MAG: dihydrofolate reductase [Candidatus Nomurabacteria bacterium]|nr:dihydrofolate reductase [Candidatus Nomurabacteria bacterium]